MHMEEYAIETVVTAQFGLPGATQAKATGLRRPLGSRSTARGKDATERSLGCGGVPPFAAGRLCQGARMRFGMGIFCDSFAVSHRGALTKLGQGYLVGALPAWVMDR